MPQPHKPIDPVLDLLLAAGEFDRLLRDPGAEAGAAAIDTAIALRNTGLSGAGSAWLIDSVLSAGEAARAMSALAAGERLEIDLIPTVPSRAVPGAEPGDLVIAQHIDYVYADDGPRDGYDGSTIVIMPPSAEELQEIIDEIVDEARELYDKGVITGRQLSNTIHSTYGIYKVG